MKKDKRRERQLAKAAKQILRAREFNMYSGTRTTEHPLKWRALAGLEIILLAARDAVDEV